MLRLAIQDAFELFLNPIVISYAFLTAIITIVSRANQNGLHSSRRSRICRLTNYLLYWTLEGSINWCAEVGVNAYITVLFRLIGGGSDFAVWVSWIGKLSLSPNSNSNSFLLDVDTVLYTVCWLRINLLDIRTDKDSSKTRKSMIHYLYTSRYIFQA